MLWKTQNPQYWLILNTYEIVIQANIYETQDFDDTLYQATEIAVTMKDIKLLLEGDKDGN